MANLEIKLEKKVDAKLDTTEKKALEWMKAENLKNKLTDLKEEKFDLTAKNKWVRLEDIVKNYNTVTSTIDLKGENIPVGKWSDLAAWIQILMVADGRNILTNEAKKRWVKLWIDGYIWAITSTAIGDYKNKTETKTNQPNMSFEKVDLSQLTSHNFYGDFLSVYWDVAAKAYKDTYKVFKDDWAFTNCSNYNGNITINYKSQYDKNFQSISFKAKDIQKSDLNIDNKKLLEIVKSQLEKKEWDLRAKTWQESVNSGIDNVQVKSFSPFMQEYLSNQWWMAPNWTIDFNPWMANGSGMNIYSWRLVISYPGKWTLTYNLSDMQTNNTFDSKKFVNAITKTIEPRAKQWKKDQLTAKYTNLDWAKIWAISNANNADIYINSYKNLQTEINNYSKVWVVLDKKVTDKIPTQIEALNNQKKYLIAKNWIDTDIKDLEAKNNKAMSRAEQTKLWKDIKNRVEVLTLWSVELYTLKVNIKDAFTKVNKQAEYTTYLNRYKALV